MPNRIKELYQKYKDMDEVHIRFNTLIADEMWKAIKYHATTEVCELCNGDGEIWMESYSSNITCPKCKGEGRIKNEKQ